MSANSNALLFKLLDAATQGQPPDEPENQIALLTEILENVKNADTLTDDLDLGGNDLTDSTQNTVDTDKNIRVTSSSELSYGRDNRSLGTSSQAIGISARAKPSNCTSTGESAGQNNTGNRTTATGAFSAKDNTGNDVTATGRSSAINNTADGLTATGEDAAKGNTGISTTVTGFISGKNNSGSNCTFAGVSSGQNNTGNRTTATGAFSAKDNTGNDVTATGRNSGQSNTGNRTTVAGVDAARGDGLSDPTTMGDDNIGIGKDAIRNNQASGLIGIGQEAGADAQQDDQLIITDQNGNRRMVMDLTNGDLKIDGSLTENSTL